MPQVKPNISNAQCVLVLGATAGIGRDLAIAIHNLPSKPTVIVTGRRQERLDELSKTYERIDAVHFNMSGGRQVLQQFVKDITAQYSKLDAVIFSAGVQHLFHFHKPEGINLELLEDELNTNYTAIVILTVLLLPHFLKLGAEGQHAFIVLITSALAIVPTPRVPNYSASKAAMHSFALSLDSQLRDTHVHVTELIPPLVESELHDHQGTVPLLSKIWMPLAEFTGKAMTGLQSGDVQVPIGESERVWDLFEKGKIEAIAERVRRTQRS